MRTALIFPPQWDPRQPPLAPAVLARVLELSGNETRVFDLNVALYQNLLKTRAKGGIEDFLLKRLFDVKMLDDAEQYLQISQKVQQVFEERFDPDGKVRLFWDGCVGLPTVVSSSGWKSIIACSDRNPFVEHLRAEINCLVEFAPDVAGFSIISDTQLSAALAIAGIIRRALPECRIVLGGDAVTYRRSLLPEMDWMQETFAGACVGDGEPFLQAMAEGKNIAVAANGIAWPTKGIAQVSNECLQKMDDSQFPDFEALPLEKYLTPGLVIPVETARGCPWGRCAFCIHPVRSATGRPLYRPKPIDLVEKEFKKLFAAGHRRFFVVDEAMPPARISALADLFLALPESVSWIGYARLDKGHTFEIFKKARLSGCKKLFVGVETGSNRILKKFNKGVDFNRARRVLLNAAAAGLAVHFFLMTGFPDETQADRQATLDLLSEVLPAFDPFGFSFDLFMLNAELETDLVAHPHKFGWARPEKDSGRDLAWQFPVKSGSQALSEYAEFRGCIEELADKVFGPAFGLRHAALAQDSLHLLLIEARERKLLDSKEGRAVLW